MVLLQENIPDVVLCYGYNCCGAANFWLFGVLLLYRHCRVNMITSFGVLRSSSFLLQIQLSNMCLQRATLLMCGIFCDKKRGNLRFIHRLQSSKDSVWQHQGWFLPMHSYMLSNMAHSFSPFQLSSSWLQSQHGKFYSTVTNFYSFRILLKCLNLELRQTLLYLQVMNTLTATRAWSVSLGNFNLNLDAWEEVSTGNIHGQGILNGYFCFFWHFSIPGGLFHVQYQGWEGASEDQPMSTNHLYRKSLLLALGMYLPSSAGDGWSLWPLLCWKEDF